jgi:Ser/Thr protein kinase RdoA (MazF antagonist)
VPVPQPVQAVVTRPSITGAAAARILWRHWQLAGTLTVLPSERDRNFLVESDDHARCVLKLSNLDESPALLDLQHLALDRLDRAGVPVQRPIPSVLGPLVVGAGEHSGPPLARLLSWLPGRPLATVAPKARSGELLRHLGRVMGQTAQALASLDAPAAHRTFQWDVTRVEHIVDTHAGSVRGASRAEILRRARARLRASLLPVLATLRRSVIHNDANDHNVLVDDGATTITGLLDLGDMVHSITANEAAVAGTYAMLDADDPIGVAGTIAAGFHETCPLTSDEIAVLVELAIARLTTSVVLSAHQARLDPSDAYLTVSEEPAWRLLDRLLAIPPEVAAGRIADACA